MWLVWENRHDGPLSKVQDAFQLLNTLSGRLSVRWCHFLYPPPQTHSNNSYHNNILCLELLGSENFPELDFCLTFGVKTVQLNSVQKYVLDKLWKSSCNLKLWEQGKCFQWGVFKLWLYIKIWAWLMSVSLDFSLAPEVFQWARLHWALMTDIDV